MASIGLPTKHPLIWIAAAGAVGGLAVLFAGAPIVQAMHEAIDLRRAELWTTDGNAEQAAFVLTMLHRAHPDDRRIAIALIRAQHAAGDDAAAHQTLAAIGEDSLTAGERAQLGEAATAASHRAD